MIFIPGVSRPLNYVLSIEGEDCVGFIGFWYAGTFLGDFGCLCGVFALKEWTTRRRREMEEIEDHDIHLEL